MSSLPPALLMIGAAFAPPADPPSVVLPLPVGFSLEVLDVSDPAAPADRYYAAEFRLRTIGEEVPLLTGGFGVGYAGMMFGPDPGAAPPTPFEPPGEEPEPKTGTPGGKPKGKPADEDGGKNTGHVAENEVAVLLADEGYDVDQVPDGTADADKDNDQGTDYPGKNPDYKIGDDYFEHKSYKPGGSTKKPRKEVLETADKSSGEGQCGRIIVDLRNKPDGDIPTICNQIDTGLKTDPRAKDVIEVWIVYPEKYEPRVRKHYPRDGF